MTDGWQRNNYNGIKNISPFRYIGEIINYRYVNGFYIPTRRTIFLFVDFTDSYLFRAFEHRMLGVFEEWGNVKSEERSRRGEERKGRKRIRKRKREMEKKEEKLVKRWTKPVQVSCFRSTGILLNHTRDLYRISKGRNGGKKRGWGNAFSI